MEFDSTLQHGLIAQELEKVVPELVHTDAEGWKSIEYSHLVPLLIESIKEQQAVIVGQEAATARLNALVANQQEEIDKLKAYKAWASQVDEELRKLNERMLNTEEDESAMNNLNQD